MHETTPEDMAAGFDALLLELSGQLVDDLPERLSKGDRKFIERNVRARIDQARSAVADFAGGVLDDAL